MNILDEAFQNSTLLTSSFDGQNLLNSKNKNDSYMFKFEISTLKKNHKIFLKIKVGFKLEYINSKDLNLLKDDNSINKENMKYQLGSLCDILKLEKYLEIFKNTGIVYALINISKGKFFIIGKKDFDIRKQKKFLDRKNAEIFYLQNFLSITTSSLKSIKPSFHFDKKYLKYFDIKFNGKTLK